MSPVLSYWPFRSTYLNWLLWHSYLLLKFPTEPWRCSSESTKPGAWKCSCRSEIISTITLKDLVDVSEAYLRLLNGWMWLMLWSALTGAFCHCSPFYHLHSHWWADCAAHRVECSRAIKDPVPQVLKVDILMRLKYNVQGFCEGRFKPTSQQRPAQFDMIRAVTKVASNHFRLHPCTSGRWRKGLMLK